MTARLQTRLKLALSAAALLSATPCRAKTLDASGYLKNLWQYTHSSLDGRPFYANTARARLSLKAQKSVWRAQADYDHELVAGSLFRTQEYRLVARPQAPTWLPLEQAISTSATHDYRHSLYRGWLGFETERGVLRIGRQRVAWGAGKLWNPTDILNPYQPASIEREERRGVDALYARLALGDLSQAELAWAPEERWPEHFLLARLKSHWKGWDLSALGGKAAASTGSWIVGGDWAATILEGTLHAEWSYTDLKTRTPFWKAGLGYDYTFSSDTPLWGLEDAAVVVEYFHNGAGVDETARYDFNRLRGGREIALGRNYVGLTLSKDPHPLWKIECAVLSNAGDGSILAAPSLQWNPLNDLYLTAGLQRFGGPTRTEFGRPANLTWLQAQYYF